MEGQAEAPRLLDQVRHVLRLHHYSIHTERSYLDWIKRYVHCHQMRCWEDLVDGERKIEAFLTSNSHYGLGQRPPGEGTRPTPPQNRPLVGRVPSPGGPMWSIMRIAAF